MFYFPTHSFLLLLVGKIGMFVLMQVSMAKWFFGDGHFKSSTSKRSSQSFQQINLGLHLKSWGTTTSVWFAPTQPYLLVSTYFPTVWWPYYHVSEVPTAACETISSNISINIGVDSVVLQDLMSTAVPFSLTIFYPNLIRTFFHHDHSSFFFFSHSMLALCICVHVHFLRNLYQIF